MATEPDTSAAQSQAAAQGPRRLKLVMPNADRARQSTSQSPSRGGHPTSSNKASSGSPERPSYSPVTPTLPEAVLSTQQSNSQGASRPAEFIDLPEALPVSLDENPDAIALRAALSILQMQRQQSMRDMRDLEKMKKAAIKDPDGFVEHLKANKLSAAAREGVDVDYEDDEDDDEDEKVPEAQSSESKFPRFPTPQNVVRAPPVEWSKYGIVGEPLDQMHEFQRRHPGATSLNSQPHQIAGPYKPFTDRLNDTKK